ncbi:hypothetical protein CBR_g37703 [Chara braunii]|uniref:DnaJ homologue subfamily C GRV2/DNAJC13 N-terminal domain-containing protein n=1 Tax=Chara braunii TaxID=69332 RepID=A0A388K003_CHABU|nr:hypothetical protein CBR_g37703 [Chara braunii]|eukprot:GBG63346.1 hypothetical protein CBR_g37703 [Chara braunii]
MDYELFLVRQPGRLQRGTLRILRFLPDGMSLSTMTPNPITTRVAYASIVNVGVSSEDPFEFTLIIDDGRKRELLKLACETRTELLTSLYNRIDDLSGYGTDFLMKKLSVRTGKYVETLLRVRSTSILKLPPEYADDEKTLSEKKVDMYDIQRIETISDDDQGVLLHLSSRVMRLSSSDAMAFVLTIQQNMRGYLGIDIEAERITTQDMLQAAADDNDRLTTKPHLYEFVAHKKVNPDGRLRDERLLRLTHKEMIELLVDEVVCEHRLEDIRGVVVVENSMTEVIVEYKNWRPTHYHLGDRDGFVAALGDVMAHMDTFTIRLESMLDCTIPGRVPPHIISEFENHLLSKLWVAYNSNRDPGKWFPVIREYSCNIQGGDSLCVEPKLMDVVADLIKDTIVKHGLSPRYLLPCCIVLERLLSARACFEAVRNHPEVIASLFACISSVTEPVVSFAAARAVKAAVQFNPQEGALKDYAIYQREVVNKHVVLAPENMHQLAAVLRLHASTDQNPLQLLGVLDVLITAVNSPAVDTEQDRVWHRSLEASLMPVCDLLCALCRSPSTVVYYSNAQFFLSLLTKMEQTAQEQLQKEALSQGVVLVFLKHAIFSDYQRVRDLSGKLLYIMMEGTEETRQETRQLLDSILPKGFMLLNDWKISTRRVDKDVRMRDVRIACWLETMEALRSEEILTPVLVWNTMKRRELLKFLEEEIEGFSRAWTVSHDAVYNYLEAHLVYSLASENHGTVVAGINLEVLVDEREQDNAAYGWKMPDPRRLFQSLFHSLMLGFTVLQERGVAEVDLRLAVHALSWVYERYSHQLQELVLDLLMIEIVVEMFREAFDNDQKVLAFKLLSFLLLLMDVGGRDNVLRFVRTNGEKVLVPMIVTTLAKCCTDVHAFESPTGAILSTRKTFSSSSRSLSVNSALSDKMSIASRPYRGEDLQRFVSFRTRASVRWLDEQLNEMLLFGLGLDMLDAILRVSATEMSTSLVPPPKAVLALGTEEILCHLAQMLLRVQQPTFGRLMSIVKNIAMSYKGALSKVYRHGFFEILLWKFICGTITDADRVSIAEFLGASHLHQDQDALAHAMLKSRGKLGNGLWQDSILQLYLPEGVIMKLCTEGAHAFVELVNSGEESPEVIWNASMRNRLVKHLEKILDHAVKARAENPLAISLFFPRPAQVYPELADAVYSTPFYLQNLLDVERFPDYVMLEPASFHTNLMQDLRALAAGVSTSAMGGVTAEWHNNMRRILLLLRAQGFVLQQYPQIHLPDDTETVLIDVASPALYVCSSMREVTPPSAIEILHQSLRVLRRVAASSDEDHDVSSTALDFAMSVLEIGQQCQVADATLSEPGFSEMVESALASALCITELAASSREGRQQLGDDPRWHKILWWVLSRAATDMASPDDNPDGLAVEMAALNCLNHFAGDEKFCFEAVKIGLHLPLLLLAVPDENTQIKVRTKQLGQSCQGLLNSSVTALRTLVNTLNRTGGMEQSTGQPMGRAAFLSILPMALLVCLEDEEDGPAKFIELSAMNLEQPLRVYCDFAILPETYEDNELEWLFNFAYETLKGQLVIGGIFIQGFASGQWQGFNLPDPGEFVESIQDFLHSNLRLIVLPGASEVVEVFESDDENDDTGSVDGANSITVADYMTVMAAFEECLKYCIQEGHEELLIHFRFPLFARIARSRSFLTEAKVTICRLVAVLASHDGMREELIFSELWGGLTVQLWDCMVAYPEEGTEEVMLATLHVLQLISMEIPSTVSAANYFLVGSVFLPVLALFLKIKLPPLLGQDPESATKAFPAQSPLISPLSELQKSTVTPPSPPEDKGEDHAEMSDLGNGADKENEEKSAADEVIVANGSIQMEDSHTKANGDETGTHDIPDSVRTAAARIISQLLLAASGLKDPASPPLDRPLTRKVTIFERDLSRSNFSAINRGVSVKVFDSIDDADETSTNVHVAKQKPVFLSWILSTVADDEGSSLPHAPTTRDDYEEGYVRELYIGGFYLDQFLRNPDFDFGNVLERRFMRELRKYISIAAPTHGNHGKDFSFDDRRRLLLAQLLLFKGRPSLLSGSSLVDIFLSVYDFISSRAVAISMRSGLLPKIADIVVDVDCSVALRQRAAEVLAVMCADKRRGIEVSRHLDKQIPSSNKGYGAWLIPLSKILDTVVDNKTLRHFLRNTHPCPWWRPKSSEDVIDGSDQSTLFFT